MFKNAWVMLKDVQLLLYEAAPQLSLFEFSRLDCIFLIQPLPKLLCLNSGIDLSVFSWILVLSMLQTIVTGNLVL